jgi:integrase
MPFAPLTSRFVHTATCPKDRAKVDFFDTGQQKGFLLEVRSSGGKTYYQRYVDPHGRQRQFKIGSADTLSLDQARRLGRTAAASVLLGSDPQTHRQELRSIPTLVELVRDRYLPHAKANKRSWHIDEMNFRRHVLPALGRLTLDEITSKHVAKLISDMRGDGYAAGTTNNVLMLLSRIFNLARKWKVPGAGDNPTSGLDRAPPNELQRFLTTEETDRLVGSLGEDENRAAAQAIMLLLLTGARRREITRAKWENVDWTQRVLRVPVSKSGKPRTIALNTAAMAVLKSIPRDSACPYIFPTRLIGVYNPWDRIRRRAGLADVRLHDLRHSFASLLVNQGVSLYVVQGLLGHASPRMTQRYAHLAPQTLLDAAEMVCSGMSDSRSGGSGTTRVRQAEPRP